MSSKPRVPSEKVPWNSHFLTETQSSAKPGLEMLTNHLKDKAQPASSSLASHGNWYGLPPAPSGSHVPLYLPDYEQRGQT